MMEPAKTVIKICGGCEAVAKMTGRHHTNVRRWTYPKEKGGTGGLIPTDAQAILYREALRLGIKLKPDHFFVPAPSEKEGDAA